MEGHSRGQWQYYNECSDIRTSISNIQLSPSSGGNTGKVAALGKDIISSRSRAYFFLLPEAMLGRYGRTKVEEVEAHSVK